MLISSVDFNDCNSIMVSKVNTAIALMGKADLTNDTIENIISMIRKDKNCKSPVVDLIHNEPNLWKQKVCLRPYKSNRFTLCREHVLRRVHNRDLDKNNHCNNYNSAIPIERPGSAILGSSCGLIYEKRKPYYKREVVGYCDKSKFTPKYNENDETMAIGFFRKGVNGGELISRQQAQEESTYNGWK